MGRIFYIQLRPSGEGLSVEITASPTLWQELVDKGGDCVIRADEQMLIYLAAEQVELPADILVSVAQLKTIRGTEEAEMPEWPELRVKSWDNDKQAFVDIRSP